LGGSTGQPAETMYLISGLTIKLRGDVIEVFKILKGYENIDPKMFF